VFLATAGSMPTAETVATAPHREPPSNWSVDRGTRALDITATRQTTGARTTRTAARKTTPAFTMNHHVWAASTPRSQVSGSASTSRVLYERTKGGGGRTNGAARCCKKSFGRPLMPRLGRRKKGARRPLTAPLSWLSCSVPCALRCRTERGRGSCCRKAAGEADNVREEGDGTNLVQVLILNETWKSWPADPTRSGFLERAGSGTEKVGKSWKLSDRSGSRKFSPRYGLLRTATDSDGFGGILSARKARVKRCGKSAPRR
jgi:hypothetical protein